MQLTVHSRIRCRPEIREDVTSRLSAYVEASQDEAGCLESVASQLSAGEFYVHHTFVSEAAVKRHQSSFHTRDLFSNLEALGTEIESVEGFVIATASIPRGQALILGGGSGIGKASGRALAELGHEVLLADLDSDRATAVAEDLKGMGLNARSAAVDVSKPEQLDNVFALISQHHKPLEILVNSAGHIDLAIFDQISDAQIERMISVHLRATMLSTRRAVQLMHEHGFGRVVNISSVAALKGARNHSHYAAAKAGILGFTKSVSQDVGGSGITVNCILPGPIQTPLLDDLSEEEITALASTPVGRIGTPEDVAHAVKFLSSREASFITGATLLVAGGSFV